MWVSISRSIISRNSLATSGSRTAASINARNDARASGVLPGGHDRLHDALGQGIQRTGDLLREQLCRVGSEGHRGA
jgi:hypothetical protein